MDQYVTGAAIRALREEKKMTQSELAERLSVSDKAVSRWETGRGYPDITLLEPLARELGVTMAELLSGVKIINRNTAGNMVRSKLYVCPLCGNILHAVGAASVGCCGIDLPPLESEPEDADHAICLEKVEDETYVTIDHPMTKEHYISFIAWMSGDTFSMVRLYPEGEAAARFKARGHGVFCIYCNHHGLYVKRV